MRQQRGFTLVELIVTLIILAVLAATAIPKFIDMSRQARVASLAHLKGTLISTAEMVHAACLITPPCDPAVQFQALTLGGHSSWISYGWPTAGFVGQLVEIDDWIDHTGFSAYPENQTTTRFTIDNAPDPVNCSVMFFSPYQVGPATPYDVYIRSSGC